MSLPKYVVLCLSGGMDSVVGLYDLIAQGCKVHCAIMEYGQQHIQETIWAKHHAGRMGCLYTTVSLPQLKAWENYSDMIKWPKAFVLQDGISIREVPNADLYFVGGSDEFKWSTSQYWCDNLPRVHIGRVRTKKLDYCERIGAESCDGSGWLRETVLGRPFRQLEAWLMNEHTRQQYLFAL